MFFSPHFSFQGAKSLRDTIVSRIEARDGYSTDPHNIFILDGTISTVNSSLSLSDFITRQCDRITNQIIVYVFELKKQFRVWPSPRESL